jgi:hypothetical protein
MAQQQAQFEAAQAQQAQQFGAGQQLTREQMGQQNLQYGLGATMGAEQAASKRQFMQGMLDPYAQAGQAATSQQQAALGLGTPEEQQAAFESFGDSPGQRFMRERQQKALLRNQAKIGGLGGGNVRSALQEQAAGFAAQDYGNYMNRLQALGGRGQQAAQTMAQQDVGISETAAGTDTTPSLAAKIEESQKKTMAAPVKGPVSSAPVAETAEPDISGAIVKGAEKQAQATPNNMERAIASAKASAEGDIGPARRVVDKRTNMQRALAGATRSAERATAPVQKAQTPQTNQERALANMGLEIGPDGKIRPISGRRKTAAGASSGFGSAPSSSGGGFGGAQYA